MFETYFEKLDINVLKENIERFWNIDFERASLEDIQRTYIECFRQGDMMEFPVRYYGIVIDQGDKLYRIRKDIDEYYKIGSVQDFSYNPKPKPGILGRFNKDFDKILYLSMSMAVPLKEVGIVSGDKFLLIEYEAIREIPVRPVNISNWYDTSDSNNKEKAEMLNMFVNQIMSVSTDENSSAYRITTLLKDFFPFSIIDETVGWFYQSTKINGSNLALTYPKAQGYIKVSDFMIVEMQPDGRLLTVSDENTEASKKKFIDTRIII